MKRKYLLLSLVLVAVLAIMNTQKVKSNKNFPLPGEVNDPTSPQTCAQTSCHPGPALASNSTLLTLQIADSVNFSNTILTPLTNSFKYKTDSTYWIEFNIQSGTGVYGFEMTAIDSLNDSMAGVFTNISGTHIAPALNNSSRQYIGHLHASSTLTWVYKWTAPSVAMPVTFYYAYNTSTQAALDSAIPKGAIYYGKVSIDPVGGYVGINDISNFVSDLNLYPNPVSSNLNLSLNLKKSETVSVNVYSIDGQMSKTLMEGEKKAAGNFNETFDIGSLASGIYLVKISAGDASVTKKITKL